MHRNEWFQGFETWTFKRISSRKQKQSRKTFDGKASMNLSRSQHLWRFNFGLKREIASKKCIFMTERKKDSVEDMHLRRFCRQCVCNKGCCCFGSLCRCRRGNLCWNGTFVSGVPHAADSTRHQNHFDSNQTKLIKSTPRQRIHKLN